MKLQREYGWRGAILILSGLMANMCVCAAIMFPNPLLADCTNEDGCEEISLKIKKKSENDRVAVKNKNETVRKFNWFYFKRLACCTNNFLLQSLSIFIHFGQFDNIIMFRKAFPYKLLIIYLKSSLFHLTFISVVECICSQFFNAFRNIKKNMILSVLVYT